MPELTDYSPGEFFTEMKEGADLRATQLLIDTLLPAIIQPRWHFPSGNSSRGSPSPHQLCLSLLHGQVCSPVDICQEHIPVAAKEYVFGRNNLENI